MPSTQPKATRSGRLQRVAKPSRTRGPQGRFLKPRADDGNSEQVQTTRRNIYSLPGSPEPEVEDVELSDDIEEAPRLLSPSPPLVGLETAPSLNVDSIRENSNNESAKDDREVPQSKRRKTPAARRKVPCYPKQSFPADIAAERRARWQKRWGEKPVNPASPEEMLRSAFWAYGNSKPRCYSCKVKSMSLASGDSAPDGTEERELLPCGCLYEASLLEMWCVKKGMFVDADVERVEREAAGEWVEHLGPKAFHKHKLLLLRFWEMLFGPFNCQVLVNFQGQRDSMLQKFGEDEAKSLSFLLPNPGFLNRARPLRGPKRREK